jgi:CHAT domain-containing protein
VVSGEGLFGFRRAFSLAGAHALVLSLWKVADAETQELMQIFYQNLRDGDTAQLALYKAKLKMRERHRDPYFWAAFVCIGHGAGAGNHNGK